MTTYHHHRPTERNRINIELDVGTVTIIVGNKDYVHIDQASFANPTRGVG